MVDSNNRKFNRRSILESIGAAGALIGFSGVTSAVPGRSPGPKNSELIVGVDPDGSGVEAELQSSLPPNAEIVHTNETLSYAAVSVSDEGDNPTKETVREDLHDAETVRYTENNETYRALEVTPPDSNATVPDSAGDGDDAAPLYTPDDPRYGSQYAPQQVNCETAWEKTLGDPNVTISVVDQGIQYDHPNLEGTVSDGVSNGGYDFVDDDGDPYPTSESESHGTHVGGIAAGGTDNGTGHAGISNCTLLSARVLSASGGGSLSDIADAIQWSADQGADVINLSLGGGTPTDLMAEACQYAYSNGSLLVAAAGNDYGGSVSYPAAYDSVVAVSSLDESEQLSDFSNVGPEIDLAAPGTKVLSSVPWDRYDSYSGTSMASPVVAGVAGLTLSAWPSLSPQELRAHLTRTAVDVGLSDVEQGSGRVDAGNAVTTDPDSSPDPDPDPDPDPGTCGDEVTNATADGEFSGGWWGNPSDTYTYQLETSDPCRAIVTLEGPESADFDLYLTLDGRTPTTLDYDERSVSQDANEEIPVDLTGNETLGILVRRYQGGGAYTLSIEERGR
ncbi:S8 family peptidase [Natrinema caseinilyticum]|uniref:S8 family peptidase n=1 Tax=Natrinema caseinilyticum TaxID=2961570 RepID=UPI0020C26129|nr:S8 family peptidase [Natrinema caseinilyticum]